MKGALDQVRRGILWAMVVSLALGGLLGAAMLLGGVGDATAWRVEGTLFGLALHCGAALFFLRGTSGRRLSVVTSIPLAVCGLNLAMLLLHIWLDYRAEDAWAQTGVLVGSAVLCLPTAMLSRKQTHRWITVIGFFCVSCSTAFTIAYIWEPHAVFGWQIWEKVLGTSWIVAVASSLASSLFAWRSHARLHWLQLTVLLLICIASAVLVIGVLDSNFWQVEFFRRVSAVFALLAISGVLTHAALSRLLRPESAPSTARSAIDLELRCPKCREDLTLPSGASSCPYCTTKFEIRVLPSACLRCGYDLASLREPTCPECGAAY